MSPLSRTRGVREVSATCNSDSVAEADGSLMLPEVLRPAPGEGISAGLVVPHVSEVLRGASVGKDVEEAQELPVNAPRGRHDTRQEGVTHDVVPGRLAYASRYRATLVRAVVSRSLLTSWSRSCPLRSKFLQWLPPNSWVQAMSMTRCL